MRSRSGRRLLVAVVTGAIATAGLTVAAAPPASAAVACQVSYKIVGSWPGGFQGEVALRNLGDVLSNWSIGFSFAGGQQVVQGWAAKWSQSGTAVTAANEAWNGTVDTGATVTAGFIGSWTGSNPVPTSFTVNGTACEGSTVPGTTTTTRPVTTTTTTTTTTRPVTTTTTTRPVTTTTTTRPVTTTTTTRPVTTTTTTTTTRPVTTTTTTRPTTTTTRPTTTTTSSGAVWNPPSNLVTGLNEVWAHQESTYGNLYGFRNYGWDQVMANGGSINYCVRWESTATVTAALRDQIHAQLARQFKKWMDAMVENGQGWNNWPYTNVPVNVVGWAVRDRNQLQWTDSSVDIYVNNIREGAPQCGEPCGRFFHQDGNYSQCPGGAARHYDMSLWLTAGMGGGAGGDWGQRIGSEYYTSNLNSDNVHILLHELGHSFGLDDFYDWTPTGVGGFLMQAGSASQITDFDKWMFRDWWRHLKSRYGR